MGKVININGKATCRTLIELNGNVVVPVTEKLDMEKALVHTKFLDNGLAILAQFGIHILEHIVGIVHLINHQIKWCMGVIESR